MEKNLIPVAFEIDQDPVFKGGSLRLMFDGNRLLIIADPYSEATERLFSYFRWFKGKADVQPPYEPVRLSFEFIWDEKRYKLFKIPGRDNSASYQLWRYEAPDILVPVSVEEFEKEQETTLDAWLMKTFVLFDTENKNENPPIENQWNLPGERIQKHLSESVAVLAGRLQDLEIQYQKLEAEMERISQWINSSALQKKSLPRIETNISVLLRELVEMNDQRQKSEEIQVAIGQLEKLIEKAHSELECEWRLYETKMDERREKASRIYEYEKELEIHHREMARLEKIQNKHQWVLEEGLQNKIRLEYLEKQIEEQKQQLAENKAALEKLYQQICPSCHSEINRTLSDAMRREYEERAEALNNRIFTCQIEADEIRHKIKKLREQYTEQEKELHRQSTVWRQYYLTEFHLQLARQQEKEYHTLKQETDRLKYLLHNRAFARKDEQAIHELQRQLDQLHYSHARWREIMESLRRFLSELPPDGSEPGLSPTSESKQIMINENISSVFHPRGDGSPDFKVSPAINQRETEMKSTEDENSDYPFLIPIMTDGLRCLMNRKKEQGAVLFRLINYLQKIRQYYKKRFLAMPDAGDFFEELAEVFYEVFRDENIATAEVQPALLEHAGQKGKNFHSLTDRKTAETLRYFCSVLAHYYWKHIVSSSECPWLIASIPFPLQDKDFIYKLHALYKGMSKTPPILLMITDVPLAQEKGIRVFHYASDGISLEMTEENQ